MQLWLNALGTTSEDTCGSRGIIPYRFPHTPVLHDRSVSVKEVYLEDKQAFRITMTAPLINFDHHIAFLVHGEGKAIAVHHVLKVERNIEVYPAQLIRNEGTVKWVLDTAAAAQLKNK